MTKVFIPANCGKREFQHLTGCKVWYRDKNKHCVSFKIGNRRGFESWSALQRYLENNFSNVKVWMSWTPINGTVFRVRVYPEEV